MNPKHLGRSLGIAVLTTALTIGAGKAAALNVLTFDTGNPERNTTVGALGFSMTQVGSNAVAGVDFGAYDVVYVAMSYQEFLTSDLLFSLGSRVGDINQFLSDGGGLVFGSPAVGGVSSGGITALDPFNPILSGVDLSTLGLSALPSLPGADPVAGIDGAPAILASTSNGNIVTWNPGEGPGLITDESLQLVENSINWAGGMPPAVPEPGTFALLGLGLAGLAYARRKRNPS